MYCNNSRPSAFVTFFNDCAEINIVRGTSVVNTLNFCDRLCVLPALVAEFHGGMNMKRIEIPGFAPACSVTTALDCCVLMGRSSP